MLHNVSYNILLYFLKLITIGNFIWFNWYENNFDIGDIDGYSILTFDTKKNKQKWRREAKLWMQAIYSNFLVNSLKIYQFLLWFNVMAEEERMDMRKVKKSLNGKWPQVLLFFLRLFKKAECFIFPLDCNNKSSLLC